jgi:hypothetical protein
MTPELEKKIDLICEAISGRKIIEFQYHEKARAVEPYVCGINIKGSYQMRAFQVGGSSASSGKLGWRIFDLAEMADLKITDTDFSGWAGDRRLYNPQDTAFKQIFCRIMKA